MRIATLQFAPKLGEVSANIERANALLSSSCTPLKDIDLLVLPELAFSGYNHPSLEAILPFLETTSSGPSTAWAKATAAALNCIVSIGFPELCITATATAAPAGPSLSKENVKPSNGSANANTSANPHGIIAYNSTITVSPQGQILAHYRKTHLYYTDETWAQEGPDGFTTITIDFPPITTTTTTTNGTGGEEEREEGGRRQRCNRRKNSKTKKIAWAICMDLNPHKFTAPWTKYEFATAAINTHADMVVVSTAWLTSLSPEDLSGKPNVPDMRTFEYWVERLSPLVWSSPPHHPPLSCPEDDDDDDDDDEEDDDDIIVVIANRSGAEPGGTDHLHKEGVRYAGSSWVGTVGRGKIKVWDMLGRAEEGVLVADLTGGGAVPRYVFRLGPVEREEEEEDWDDDGEGGDEEREREADE